VNSIELLCPRVRAENLIQPKRISLSLRIISAQDRRSAMSAIHPLTALAVVLATAATDAVYVLFTSAVVARKRVPAATWSSIWYLLSSFAVISYTENWVYVGFAAVGSWIGAYASMTFLHRPPGGGPIGAAPD
jgi:hypothetical protein